MKNGCVFCDYEGPSEILDLTPSVYMIEPLDPVTPGHVLVIPKAHVPDFTSEQEDTVLKAFAIAADRAYGMGDVNLITSKGEAATQTIGHLHFHLVPRREGDGLALPWNPQGAVRCLCGYDKWRLEDGTYICVNDRCERHEPIPEKKAAKLPLSEGEA